MKRVSMVYIIVLIYLQSCTSPTAISSGAAPEIDNLSAVTAAPSVQTTPLISSEESALPKNCLNIRQNDYQQETLSNSRLIIDNREVSSEGGRYLPGVFALDLATSQKIRIDHSGEAFLDISASPDKDLIAYELFIEPNTHKLVISNTDFQPKKIVDWKSEWDRLMGWSDESHVLFTKHRDLEPDEHFYTTPSEIIILDINTLSEKIQTPDFPSMYDFPPLPMWGTVEYNLNFDKAIYMRWTNENRSSYGYALWDMRNNKELNFQKIVGAPTPRWSPDGSFVITSGLIDTNAYELFAIYDNGQIKQLTNFGKYFLNPEVYNFSWSPNGRYLAILLKEEFSDPKATLFLLNIETGVLTNYCITVTIQSDKYSNPFVPLWSPNSNELVVQNWYSIDHRRIILINISDNYAIDLAEDVEPLAWLK